MRVRIVGHDPWPRHGARGGCGRGQAGLPIPRARIRRSGPSTSLRESATRRCGRQTAGAGQRLRFLHRRSGCRSCRIGISRPGALPGSNRRALCLPADPHSSVATAAECIWTAAVGAGYRRRPLHDARASRWVASAPKCARRNGRAFCGTPPPWPQRGARGRGPNRGRRRSRGGSKGRMCGGRSAVPGRLGNAGPAVCRRCGRWWPRGAKKPTQHQWVVSILGPPEPRADGID